ncbi:hypothetical protein BG74_03380 [Sodalis-like endosymbiont of Proechinophthirus fluctus]|nr:hypothetical protein BG74_03380 [Sodalis-like endosymbiont of Proechinophthirus fluctus]
MHLFAETSGAVLPASAAASDIALLEQLFDLANKWVFSSGFHKDPRLRFLKLYYHEGKNTNKGALTIVLVGIQIICDSTGNLQNMIDNQFIICV